MEVITFDIINMHYQYNAILNRATLKSFGTITHHNYLCMKIPTPGGVITIRRDQDLARQMELEVMTKKHHVYTVEQEAKKHEGPSVVKWTPKSKLE